jgi:MoxR-like ATPase
MGDAQDFRLYSGDGTTLSAKQGQLPLFERVGDLENPANYLADKGLRDAVNVALTLGQPLLLAGEPGTGKTQLAGSLAHELGLPPPLVCNVKTTSTAQDLFYRYDALRHFHDSQFRTGSLQIEEYLNYEAFGSAILLSLDPQEVNSYLPEHLQNKGPTRSVVLIDEIDKAPRDLPNDILNEVESMSFRIKETRKTFSSDQRYRPILVFTSNSEKNLPDAFLRRCIFYYIAFPDAERLKQIVQRRLRLGHNFTPAMLDHAIQHFQDIRELGLKKRPATAELLGWMQILQKMDIDVRNLKPGQAETLAFSYSILAKTKEDFERLQQELRVTTLR